jgi:hypothetical protein
MNAFTVRGLATASLVTLGLAGCMDQPRHLSSPAHHAEPARGNPPRRAPLQRGRRLVIIGRVTATLPEYSTKHLRARGVPGATVSLLAGESVVAETFTRAQGRFVFRVSCQPTMVIVLPLQQAALTGSSATALTAGPAGSTRRTGHQIGDITRLGLTPKC